MVHPILSQSHDLFGNGDSHPLCSLLLFLLVVLTRCTLSRTRHRMWSWPAGTTPMELCIELAMNASFPTLSSETLIGKWFVNNIFSIFIHSAATHLSNSEICENYGCRYFFEKYQYRKRKVLIIRLGLACCHHYRRSFLIKKNISIVYTFTNFFLRFKWTLMERKYLIYPWLADCQPPVNLRPLSPYVQWCLSLYIRWAIAEESEPGLARMQVVFGLLLGFALVAASSAQRDRTAKPGKMCDIDVQYWRVVVALA